MDFKQSNIYNSAAATDINPDYSIRRQIIVEEVFKNLHCNTAYVRKITCEEVYDYQKKRLQLQVLQNAAQIDSLGCTNTEGVMINAKFQSSLLNHGINTNVETYRADDPLETTALEDICEETPMEIDSSSDQLVVNEQDINRNANQFRKRKIQKINKKKAFTQCSNNETCSAIVPVSEPLISKFAIFLLVLITLLTLVGIYIVIAGDHFIYVNRKVQAENIKKELQEHVLYQDDAVKIVIQNFEHMDLWIERVKVLPFIGSTGVGKTFTVNIIKKHFCPYLVHEVDRSYLTNTEKQQSTVANLKSCCCNLIIIDNLNASDFYDFLNFVGILPRSHNLLIIPIFNIQDTVDGIMHEIKEDDFKLIRSEFEKSGLYYELVLFDMLKMHMIEKWLRKELHKRQVQENRHDSLVKFLLNNNHVKYKGFKGFNAKLLLALDGS